VATLAMSSDFLMFTKY